MTTIHALPPEIIYEIATYLTQQPETAEAQLSAFARTDRQLYALVDPFLYRYVVKNNSFYLLHWAAEHGNLGVLKKALLAGADPGLPWKSPWPFEQTEPDYRPIEWHLFQANDLDFRSRACKIIHAADKDHGYWFTPDVRSQGDWEIRIKDDLTDAWDYIVDWDDDDSASDHSSDLVGLGPAAFDNDESEEDPGSEHISDSEHDDDDADAASDDEDMDGDADDINDENQYLIEQYKWVCASNLSFKYWWAPLHVAVAKGHTHIVDTLLKHTTAHDVSSNGLCRCTHLKQMSDWEFELVTYTALHTAICSDEYDIAKKLVLAGATQTMCTRPGDMSTLQTPTPMKGNVLNGALSVSKDVDIDFVKFLLETDLDAQINERNHNHQTAIFIAVQHKRWDIAVLLVEHGADINLPGPRLGRPPGIWEPLLIWELLANCETEHYQKLLDLGADVTAVSSSDGKTVLHAVCTRPIREAHDTGPGDYRVDILTKLLATQAKQFINAFTADGKTPLAEAVAWIAGPMSRHSTSAAMVNILLDHGADLLAEAVPGSKTPLELAIDRSLFCSADLDECERVLTMLKKTKFLVYHPRRSIMEKLLCRILQGRGSPTFWFYYVLVLLQAGVDPEIRDKKGSNALSIFLQAVLCAPPWLQTDIYQHRQTFPTDCGHAIKNVMLVLQQFGARLDVANDEGLTPLDYLRRIQSYDGEDKVRKRLAKVVRRQIQIHPTSGTLVFHPGMVTPRDLQGEDTIERLYNDKSRWVLCRKTYHKSCEGRAPGKVVCDCPIEERVLCTETWCTKQRGSYTRLGSPDSDSSFYQSPTNVWDEDLSDEG